MGHTEQMARVRAPSVGRVRSSQTVKMMALEMPYQQWRRKVHVFNDNQFRYGAQPLEQA